MMTTGSASPLNAGVMAFRPSAALFKMALWFAARASYDAGPELLRVGRGGWANGGALPVRKWFTGLDLGQGFLWTLMFGNGHHIQNATSGLAAEAHRRFRPFAGWGRSRLIDRCRYNFQRERRGPRGACAADFSCGDMVLLHKAHGEDSRPPTACISGEPADSVSARLGQPGLTLFNKSARPRTGN